MRSRLSIESKELEEVEVGRKPVGRYIQTGDHTTRDIT